MLQAARRRFPAAPEPFLDLSTGINPLPYPVPALPPEVFTRLPEPEEIAALERAAAEAYGANDPALVVAAPGTQILIGLIPRLWPATRVGVIGPTYGEHAAAWMQAGAKVDTLTDLPRPSGAHHAVVLCNPNNPDGRRWSTAELLAFADRLAADGSLMLVDEAFADFEAAGLSLAAALPHPAIVVLRSFGKAYGLAGLRLGFALAASERARMLRAVLGPWAVSGPAIAIGTAALADRNWRDTTAARLAAEAQALDRCLGAAGLAVSGGTALFRFVETNQAAALADRLGRAGILVRAFADRPSWLRFGIPADLQARLRLERALAKRS